MAYVWTRGLYMGPREANMIPDADRRHAVPPSPTPHPERAPRLWQKKGVLAKQHVNARPLHGCWFRIKYGFAWQVNG